MELERSWAGHEVMLGPQGGTRDREAGLGTVRSHSTGRVTGIWPGQGPWAGPRSSRLVLWGH